jgi:hypothetical protein
MDKVKLVMRTTPFVGVGFVVGTVIQLPLLISIGAVRGAIIQGVLFILGASWSITGFVLCRSHKHKIVEYLKAEGFDLSEVKGGRVRTK